MNDIRFTYSAVSGRYRAPNGQYVADSAVRQAVDQVLDASTARVRALSQRLLDGQTSLAEWQQVMATELRTVHVAVGIVAHGGQAEMSNADFGWIGQRLRTQYSFLRGMAEQIASGAQPLDGRLLSRATLYSEASRQTFEEMRRRDARLRGGSEERRMLRASESCSGCVAQAGQGWQPAGVLPPLGSEACRTRCKCVWATRTVPAA